MKIARRTFVSAGALLPTAVALTQMSASAAVLAPTQVRRDISDEIARFVSNTQFKDLPAATIANVRRSVLDAIGCGIAASGLEPACLPFVAQARALKGAGRSRILGHGFSAPAPYAALANGAFAHALDYEDVHEKSSTHPNAATVAAAFAVAEELGGVSGERLIAAIAVGCELAIRLSLGRKDDWTRAGWYMPPIVGAFGATAAAASLLGLDAAATKSALSLVLCQSSCSAEILHSPTSDLRAIRDGFAAQAGVLSATLARDGVIGFEEPFEGKAGFATMYARGNYDFDALMDGLGQRFHTQDVAFKLWPSCRGTQLYVQAAIALHAQGASDVADMLCIVDPRNAELSSEQKKRPVSAIDGKFSIPFTVAAALRTGNLTLSSFLPDALIDPATLALSALVRTEWNAPIARPMSQGGGELLHVTLKNGTRLSMGVQDMKGSIADPLSDDQLYAKFLNGGALGASPAPIARLRKVGTQLLSLNDVRDVSDLLQGL